MCWYVVGYSQNKKKTFEQCFPDSVHTCPRTFLGGDSTCGSLRVDHKVTHGEGYRGHCKELKSGPLRSNLVRSAPAAYVTFCKLETEYPLTALATPPLHKSMNDNQPCLHYLATSQLLLQASASAPPGIMCGEACSEAVRRLVARSHGTIPRTELAPYASSQLVWCPRRAPWLYGGARCDKRSE